MKRTDPPLTRQARALGFPPPEVIAELVRLAALAPSMHNTQPWRFQVVPVSQTIELHADPSRMLRYSDPHGRAMHIACGAALFNLRTAVAMTCREPVVGLLPDAGRPLLLAALRLAGPYGPCETDFELHAAIAERHTNRQAFSNRLVPPGILAELAQAAAREGAVLNFPPTPVRDCTPCRHQPEHYAWFEDHPQLAVLATMGDTRADWLRAGQALQRVMLTATARGIAASPLTQLETSDAWLVGDPLSGSEKPQMILRFGYGLPVPGTPRRPVTDVLDEPH